MATDIGKTKAYTGTGDIGMTSLFGGLRIRKSSIRIEAYGAVDELNSYLGVCIANSSSDVKKILQSVQKDLFVLGADLATPLGQKTAKPVPRITKEHINELEKTIDPINAKLPTLRRFILPSGTEAAANLQYARAIARKAERRAELLKEAEDINSAVIPYLNRLSSLLFVLARYENWKRHIKEKEWVS